MENKRWVRSSFCSLGDCVEVAATRAGRVAIRDSRNPGVELEFSGIAWWAFVSGIRSGELDRVWRPRYAKSNG